MVVCEYCNKEFKNNNALGGHKSIVHSEKIECNSCGRLFSKANIVLHEKSCHNRGNCQSCGEKISRKNGKYCSHRCQHDYRRKINFNKIESGDVLSVKWMKKYLIETSGENCDKCGWGETNEHSGNIPIELDHIDGNYKNNQLDNLRLLCPNCHSLTKTYKNLNKGNGRAYRRKSN